MQLQERGLVQRPTMLAGSTLWQAGAELAGSGGDDKRWKAVACKLAMVFGSKGITSKESGQEARFSEGMTGVAPDSAYANYDIFPKLAHPLNNVALFRGKYVVGQPERCYRTLPPAEMLPRGEALGGYIFVCNNDTMEEDLRRQLFGLPPKYKDSVRAITPGLPLFLYNYTAHQLHGVFLAVSFGGSNIDPTAWEDKKCRGESRFPAQVKIRVKKMCKPLEEDAFRPILHHYDGPKFRLQLSVPEALALLDLFMNDTV